MGQPLSENSHLIAAVEIIVLLNKAFDVDRFEEQLGLFYFSLVTMDLSFILLDLKFNLGNILGCEASTDKLHKEGAEGSENDKLLAVEGDIILFLQGLKMLLAVLGV